MTWLAEDPLPIWLGGAILLTAAAVVYLQLRTQWAFWSMAGVIGLVVVLLAVEKFWVTPREKIVQTLHATAAAVEANDAAGVLSHISPEAGELRRAVEGILGRVKIARAKITTTPEVTLSPNRTPPQATARIRYIVDAVDARAGFGGAYPCEATIELSEVGGRWLIDAIDQVPQIERL
jgi:hypothetical protein